MDFNKIDFGKSAAEKESKYLEQVFLNLNNYLNNLQNGNTFLIIGPKGSGKSAFGIMLEKESKKDKNCFVKKIELKTFPYHRFSELLPKSEAIETRLPLNWEFLLLIEFLNSFNKDPTCNSGGDYDFEKVVELMKHLRILPNKEIIEIINTTISKHYTVDLKFLNIGKTEEFSLTQLNQRDLYEILKDVCYSIKLNSKHKIIIDGLDSVITNRKDLEKQFDSLSALLVAVDLMNQKFCDSEIDAKVIVLCRSDLLTKLVNPDRTKIISDSSVYLDWYQGEQDISSSNLVRLINKRATFSLGTEIDVFKQLLPPKLTEKQAISEGLLHHTRWRPRDLIELFRAIQNETSGLRPNLAEVWDGIHKYSSNHFIGEITDELIGFLKPDDRNLAIQLLMAIGKTPFYITDVQKEFQHDERFKELHFTKIFEALYECSAIGNLNRKNHRQNWKYKNRHSKFDPNQLITVHSGLLYALNIKKISLRDNIEKRR
jgi:archaellum biogenesis ATPase FlaH